MICGKCRTENPDGSLFCLECGASLENKVNLDKGTTPPSDPFAQGNPYEQGNTMQNSSGAYIPQQTFQGQYPQQNPYPQQSPYPQQQESPYRQPMVNYPVLPNNDDEHMTALDWIGRWAINLIPMVGPIIYIVMLFVWAFGDTRKKSLRTYAQAQLILCALGIALCLFILLVCGISLSDLANEL